MSDQELKKKMESLDALTGGVVYGKEEAWDKLQARLDKKARPIFFSRYRMAAAAALLVCICLPVMYYYITGTPQSSDTIVRNVTIVPKPKNNIELPLDIPEEQEPATTQTVQIKMNHAKRETTNVQFVIAPTKPIAEQPTQPIDTIQNEYAQTAPEPTAPMPTPISRMRVVHINNLDASYEQEQDYAATYKGPSLDISKMKVVSIYDVQQEDWQRLQQEDMIRMVRINRPHSGLFGISYQLTKGRSGYSGTMAVNPFSISINRKQ